MKSLCIDFDGVLHLYPTGKPVPGAKEFLEKAVREFEVSIFSTRSSDPKLNQEMQQWLLEIGVNPETVHAIKFPISKPPAYIFLDDRAICFKGIFPSLVELHEFESWQDYEVGLIKRA